MVALNDLPAEIRKNLRKSPQPDWISPMLATLSEEHISRADWIYEWKFDGERCLAFVKDGQVHLFSRNKKLLNSRYPELIAPLLKQQSRSFILDGEIVTFDKEKTSFSRLQGRMQLEHPSAALIKSVPIFYYIFDLLALDGYDTTQLPLIQRKTLLQSAISFQSPLRFSAHREKDAEGFYKEACKKDWEGIIAKRADGHYIQGRSRDWLKYKCLNRQEFVIGGYTDPQRSRIGFGALLVGYYDGNKLRYAGKVGTGFDTRTLQSLYKKLSALGIKSSPFAEEDLPRGAHWVRPQLVGEVGFAEWTNNNHLRHPRFLGLRDDKKPSEVVRERA